MPTSAVNDGNRNSVMKNDELDVFDDSRQHKAPPTLWTTIRTHGDRATRDGGNARWTCYIAAKTRPAHNGKQRFAPYFFVAFCSAEILSRQAFDGEKKSVNWADQFTL